LDHIHRHYSEPLHLDPIARLSGFAPDYFSKLFKQREHMTFERYVRGLRLERAKQLLTTTELGVTRVGELSGFGSAQYFCTVFRASVGFTARDYRRRSRPGHTESRAVKQK
jgi:two-component system response regulator YesN